MNLIQLPPVLPGTLDLANINRQLRDRTAQLDWSAVVSATEPALSILLEGLDLFTYADELGVDGTMNDSIASEITRWLNQQKPPTRSKSSTLRKSSRPKPAVWEQPSLIKTEVMLDEG
jgi:hypothetical protein